MRVAPCLFAAVTVIAVLAAPALAGPTVVVRKIDDTTVTGDLTAVADGKLTVTPKGTPPVVVSLDEVSQVMTAEQQAAAASAVKATTVTPPPPPTKRKSSGGLLAAVFGSSSDDDDSDDSTSNHAAAEPAPAPKPAPPPVTPTTKPAADVAWTVTLTDGDTLHAFIPAWSDQKLTVRPSALPDRPTLTVPADQVAELWAGTPDLVAKARAVTVAAGPEDVAYVQQKDGQLVAVRGAAVGIDGDDLTFKFDDKDRKISLARLVGLVFRGNAHQPLAGFHQLVRLTGGDALSGQWVGLADQGTSLTLKLPVGTTVSVPFRTLAGIDCVNGRQVWLSDLTPAAVEQTPYFGRVMPYQVDHGLTGGPIVLADGAHARGVAVHSRCVLTYDLAAAGGFDQFKAKLGFEQPGGHVGRVAAKVVGDGKVLWQADDARGDAPPTDIDVPLTGVKRLVLTVDFGQGQDVGDRVVWADPRLVRAKPGL